MTGLPGICSRYPGYPVKVTELYPHTAPTEGNAVCWLLDVREYGLNMASQLHPGVDPWPAPCDAAAYNRAWQIIRNEPVR
jgi:hypothetical protein